VFVLSVTVFQQCQQRALHSTLLVSTRHSLHCSPNAKTAQEKE
jgi:hypothetical protein